MYTVKEVIKEVISRNNRAVFVGGIASALNGYKSWSQIKDIDIVLPNIDGFLDAFTYTSRGIYSKGEKRASMDLKGYQIDIFFGHIEPEYVEYYFMDGIKVNYINKEGQYNYYKSVIPTVEPDLQMYLYDKYKNELNYI